jgi:hypothetical protein
MISADSVCPWEKIDRFTGPRELTQFGTWMADQITNGSAEELAAPPDRSSLGGRWFKHLASGQVWELTVADGPHVPSFRRASEGRFQ